MSENIYTDKKFEEVMDDLEISIIDSDGNLRNFYDIFLDFEKAMNKLNEEEKERIAKKLNLNFKID